MFLVCPPLGRGATPVPGSFQGLWSQVLSRRGTPVPGSFQGLWSQVLCRGAPQSQVLSKVFGPRSYRGGGTQVPAGGYPSPGQDRNGVLPIQDRTGVPPSQDRSGVLPLARTGLGYSPGTGYAVGSMPRVISCRRTWLVSSRHRSP